MVALFLDFLTAALPLPPIDGRRGDYIRVFATFHVFLVTLTEFANSLYKPLSTGGSPGFLAANRLPG